MSSCALLPFANASRLLATQTSQVRAFSYDVASSHSGPVYGWRSAEVGNLARMQEGGSWVCLEWESCSAVLDYPLTEQILLEQNYRSTRSILNASLAIVAQGMFPNPS